MSGQTYVVGIGASAGGLDALERFFDHLPVDTGMAFVLVQHLSPDFKSLMDELLARHTDLPIHQVEDGMPIEPNHVYLIPAKKEMIISQGKLLLSERDRQQELTLPIDVFFRSLAQDCGPRASAIVLSGSGSDGSRGAKDVYEAGGLVIVQDPSSAQFDGMPKAALEAGVAHYVAHPDEIPRILLEHSKEPHVPLAPKPDVSALTGLDAVYHMLEGEFGIDFTHYKPSTVTRRIERRLQLSRANDIDDYVAWLRRERQELDALYRDLLIGVTHFFRNTDAFEVLAERILPDLVCTGNKDAPLRVWVAGCATGEEAYSLAIILNDVALRFGSRPIKIFASDVHRGSLDIAARGVYDAEAVANVSPERLERYFLKRGRSYQVVPDIRQMVVFAPHNVIKDPPFTRVDMVTCRNLLIYLQPPAQQKVLSLFHFALNRAGILFLGPSESPGPMLHDFETIDAHWRIYRKHSDVRIPMEPRVQRAKAPDVRPDIAALAPRYSLSQLLGAYDTLLDEFMPASLLVNERGELVHAFAGASRFLKLHDGRQGLDLLDIVDNELKMVLVGGLKRALKESSAVVFSGVRLSVEGSDITSKVTIRPIRARGTSALHLLVTIEPSDGAPRSSAPTEGGGTKIDLDQVSREQLAALEAELSHTKENLQAAIEELETSNEELQASNEELVASNEELQSTNEELQSVNEELYTVNAEHSRRITELTEITNDMDNLLSSTDIGTIFLDAKLRIRKFTPQIAESFNLLPQDVGRPIETFANKMNHPELVEDLKRVVASGEPIEREIRDRGDRFYFLRILPYRAKGTIDGVVLTMIDVSTMKLAEDALFHERYLLNSLLAGVPDAICFKDARGRFIRSNRAMANRLGLADPSEAIQKTVFDLCPSSVASAWAEQDDQVLKTGEPQLYRLEKRAGTNGDAGWDLVTRLPLRDRSDQIVGMIVIIRDVSQQKLAEEKIQESVRRRDQFLAMLSHELRNPLGAVVTAMSLLRGEGADGERRNQLLAVVDRQTHQMGRLLDDLLEASRVTQNKIELRRRVVDLRVVTQDAVNAMRGVLEKRELEFIVKVGEDPIWVDGDPTRLQQIQINLLSNAAKYTPPGGHVEIDVHREGEEAVIAVRDDGIGIPADMLEQVFDLFVQSRHTLDRSEGGLGVGLTLVRGLVNLHGGTVKALSQGEGKGAELLVRLPTTTARPEVAPAPLVRRRPEGASVVLIEDNRDSRVLLCDILRLSGFDCESAGDARDGFALIEEKKPNIVIADIGLPGMDGFELARRLRADPRHATTYLVALTGYGQPIDRTAALTAGFDEHVVKPIEPERLIAMLTVGHRGEPADVRTMNSNVTWRSSDQI